MKTTIGSVLLALLGISAPLCAQHASIGGKVQLSDGSALESVQIRLKGTNHGAYSKKDGTYLIDQIKPGTYAVSAHYYGLSVKDSVVNLTENEHVVLNWNLPVNSHELQEVVIVARQNPYNTNQLSNSLRLTTPSLEVPQNIQIITAKSLSDQQVTDMLEGVTRNVSGATRLEHWDNYARINMRGSQLTAFRNGMNVQMPWGPLAEDMSMVERIEFVKGPAGFMMANGEPSGFYNVVTKKPTGTERGAYSMMLGSFDTYRTSIDLDGFLSKNKKLTYRFNAMGQLKGSHRDYEYTNRVSVAPVICYQINDKTTLTAEYTYQYMQMSMVGSAYAFSKYGYAEVPVNFTTAENNLAPTNINDHSLFVTLQHQLSKYWKLTTQLAYLRYNQVGSSMWPWSLDSAGNLTRGISIWDALGQSKQGQVFVTGDVTTGPLKHRILGGLDMNHKEYYADWMQGYALNGTAPFNIYAPVYGNVPADSLQEFDRSKSIKERGVYYGQSTASLYLQDEVRFWEDKIRLTLAGRYTHSTSTDPYSGSTDDSKFTPRVGLSVSILKTLAVYALYDQAYVPQAGMDAQGKSFDPITGDNKELGVKKEWFGGKWKSSLSLYRITKNNVLTTDPDNVNFSVQLGQTQTQGVEVDVTGQLMKGLDVIVNYALTDGKITKDSDAGIVGNRIAGTAKHVANAWLSYHVSNGFLRGLGASIGIQYQGERSSWYVYDGSEQALPDYYRLDGSVFYQKEKVRLALNVNNITDRYLFSGAPYYGMYYFYQIEAGRNYRLSLTYTF